MVRSAFLLDSRGMPCLFVAKGAMASTAPAQCSTSRERTTMVSFLNLVVWNLHALQRHRESVYPQIYQSVLIIRTHLLSGRFGSDYRCLVHPARLERATSRVGVWHSIQLSYGSPCLKSKPFKAKRIIALGHWSVNQTGWGPAMSTCLPSTLSANAGPSSRVKRMPFSSTAASARLPRQRKRKR